MLTESTGPVRQSDWQIFTWYKKELFVEALWWISFSLPNEMQSNIKCWQRGGKFPQVKMDLTVDQITSVNVQMEIHWWKRNNPIKPDLLLSGQACEAQSADQIQSRKWSRSAEHHHSWGQLSPSPGCACVWVCVTEGERVSAESNNTH